MNYHDYCIDTSLTVREAMDVIEHVNPHIVFVVESEKIKASLTDGDIRRYLINGGQVTDSALLASNTQTLCVKTHSEAVSFYDRNNYIAIPIVDDGGKLVDIYIGNKTIQKKINLNIPVVINAGGKGTRLEPYTKILPKPLIPVGEFPIIEHIMQRFITYGCEEFSIIVNYKKQLIKAYFSELDKEYNIKWYDEEKPLGTGGGLYYLKGKISSTFFFTNCDNLLMANYEDIIDYHKNSRNTITIICANKNIKIPYGVIDMGISGVLEGFREKPELSFLTNTGIYVVEPEVLDVIEDDIPIGFPEIIDTVKSLGKKIGIYPVSENDWLDMGQLSELEKMRIRLYGE